MLHTISIFSVLAPLAVGLANYKYLEANAKALLLLVAFATVPQMAVLFTDEIPVVYYNSYLFVDVILWPVIFYLSSQSKKLRTAFIILMLINLVINASVISYLSIDSRFIHELVCLDSILQAVYVSLFFYELNLRNEYLPLLRLPQFWFSIGILFYAPCTFFMFLFFNEIRTQYPYLRTIHHFFNILLYLLFVVGLSIKSKKPDVRS